MQEKKIRIVTAASLFDGHDAAINIMRRIIQSKGAEVIHLGHNRAALEIVEAAIQEDAQAIAITSYQGGHVEFFKYLFDLLKERNCSHIQIFGGGGGTILPTEMEELHAYGIARIYSPDDGRSMGLEGMITDLLQKIEAGKGFENDFTPESLLQGIKERNQKALAKAITLAENGTLPPLNLPAESPLVLGITGTGGAGKSSVVDEIVRRFLMYYPTKNIAVISVDPSKKKTGGALLGDRIRMNSIFNARAFMRSLATRESEVVLNKNIHEVLNVCKLANFDFIILETAGAGQSDASITSYSDLSLYIMTPEYGAASQLEKINMLDYADLIAINKFDKAGALDSLHDVRKQYKRNHNLFTAKDEELPIVGTVASLFNDAGVNQLMDLLIAKANLKMGKEVLSPKPTLLKKSAVNTSIIPPHRTRYLAEIAEKIEDYDAWAKEQADIATKLFQLDGALAILQEKE